MEEVNHIELVRQLVVVVIPTLVIVLTQLVKKLTPIPNEWLPVVAPLAGAVLAVIGSYFQLPALEASVVGGAALGSTATGVHQIVAQRRA